MNTNPGPHLAVDAICVDHNRILLIKRKNPPYEGHWAMPGGFVEYGESAPDAVKRELLEETGLKAIPHILIGVYSKPERDPRIHVVSIVYWMVLTEDPVLRAGDDAREAAWVAIKDLGKIKMAFDHSEILNDFLNRWEGGDDD